MSLLRKVRRLREEGYLRPSCAPKIAAAIWNGLRTRLTGDGTFRTEVEVRVAASSRPARLVDGIVRRFAPRSVLDLGCGVGGAIDLLVERGVEDVVGVENSDVAIAMARRPERIIRHDLTRPLDLGRRFDLVLSLEFLEHTHPRYEETVLANFSRHGDLVVLTAARPGQGGQGHLNERPAEHWIRRFAGMGFAFDEGSTEALRALRDAYWENLLVFRRFPGGGPPC